MFVIISMLVFLLFLVESFIRSLKVDGWDQKFIFITGCDSGFGQKLAIRLDSLGFPVFAACLTDEGQTFLSEKTSSRLATLSLDVTKTEDVHKALDFVKGRLPPGTGLWAIVNNAGIAGPIVPIEMCPPDECYKTLAVNVCGPVDICRQFLPLLRMCKGRVVNVSSVAGRLPCTSTPYNVSKFAMEGFSDSLRQEVYNEGIKVSILEPGTFLTGSTDGDEILKNVKHFFHSADEDVREFYSGCIEASSRGVARLRQDSNTNLEPVLDAFTHAIVSRFPKTRYVIGWDARFVHIPLSYLPSAFSCWLICRSKRNM